MQRLKSTLTMNNKKPTFAILLAISIAHLLNDAVQSVIPSIYPILKSEFSLSFTQIGIITLFFQMTSSILQPFVGRYADKRPSPYALTFGMGVSLAGLLLLAYSNSFYSVITSVSIIGIGSSIFHPEASRVAQIAAGTQKSLAQSIFQVGGNGGSAIGPLLAAIIILPNSMKAIIWFGIALIIGAIIVSWVGKWYRQAITAQLHNRSNKIQNTASPLSPKKIKQAMIILVLLTFSKQFYLSSMTSYFTFFLIDKFDISIKDAQFCLFGFLAASAIGIIIGGYVGDRIGRKMLSGVLFLEQRLLPYYFHTQTIGKQSSLQYL